MSQTPETVPPPPTAEERIARLESDVRQIANVVNALANHKHAESGEVSVGIQHALQLTR